MRALVLSILFSVAAFCGAPTGAIAEESPNPIIDYLPPSPDAYVVLFEPDSITLMEPAKAVLDQMIRDYQVYKPSVVDVNGYYDRILTESAARDLSRKMAEAVRDYLVANGMTPSVIELAWFGEAHPQVETADGIAEAANRSVDVIFDNRKNPWRR